MRGSCRTLIGLEASGIPALRDSLKKNQHRVRGVVWQAGQGRLLETDICADVGLDGCRRMKSRPGRS